MEVINKQQKQKWGQVHFPGVRHPLAVNNYGPASITKQLMHPSNATLLVRI